MSCDHLNLDEIHERWCEGAWTLATPDIAALVAEVRRLRAREARLIDAMIEAVEDGEITMRPKERVAYVARVLGEQ